MIALKQLSSIQLLAGAQPTFDAVGSGASAEERAATKADLDAIWDVTRGVLAIADTKLDPEELAARLEYWHCPDIRAKTPLALAWLTKFQMGVENNDQIS